MAIIFAMCAPARACHETIVFTKAEVDRANIRLYERDVSDWDRNPAGFDQKHGLIGEIIGNQQVFAQELGAWRLHPDRFDHEHHGLWRVIDGDVLFHKKHPYQSPIPSMPPGWRPPGGGAPKSPCPPPGGKPGGSIYPDSAVPEPSSGVLALTALAAGLFIAGCRRMQTHKRRSRRMP